MLLNKDNLILVLSKLGNKTHKSFSGMKIDLWVTGGANLVYSFDFRESTVDIDVIKSRAIDLRDIVLEMEEELDLPHNWLNDSVMFSASFSKNLRKYSSITREFGHSLVCHFLSPIAILAMKIRANRPERSDMLDACCIYYSSEIKVEELIDVYRDLYQDNVPERFLDTVSVLDCYFAMYDIQDKIADIKRLNDLAITSGADLYGVLSDMYLGE